MKPTEVLINEHNSIKTMLRIMNKIAENISTGKCVETKDAEQIVDFLKIFADKCHHGKEENSLFPALEAAGIAKGNGPIGVMLREHTIGRGYIQELNTAIEKIKIGYFGCSQLITNSILNYTNLLQSHIEKEENVLFPMAEKVLTEHKKLVIWEEFARIEEDVVGNDRLEHYQQLLTRLEKKYLR
jgi:hemerythrin-like domain-containing protein